MVATLPAALRQHKKHVAGSARERTRHSMCTSDGGTRIQFGQCGGDLKYSEELGERDVSALFKASRRVARQHTQQAYRMDLMSDALAVLTT